MSPQLPCFINFLCLTLPLQPSMNPRPRRTIVFLFSLPAPLPMWVSSTVYTYLYMWPPSYLCILCVLQPAQILVGRRRRLLAGPPTGRPPRRRAWAAEVGAPAGRRAPRTHPAPLAPEFGAQFQGKRRGHWPGEGTFWKTPWQKAGPCRRPEPEKPSRSLSWRAVRVLRSSH